METTTSFIRLGLTSYDLLGRSTMRVGVAQAPFRTNGGVADPKKQSFAEIVRRWVSTKIQRLAEKIRASNVHWRLTSAPHL